MTQEERTRDEVLRMMLAQSAALEAITHAVMAIMAERKIVNGPKNPPTVAEVIAKAAGPHTVSFEDGQKQMEADRLEWEKANAAKKAAKTAKPREVLTRPKGKPELPVPTVGERMAMDKATEEAEAEANEKLMSAIAKEVKAIVPVKPGKTLADLHAALQACISKYGMPVAKERLAPFPKMTAVPDSEIGAVIDRLVA